MGCFPQLWVLEAVQPPRLMTNSPVLLRARDCGINGGSASPPSRFTWFAPPTHGDPFASQPHPPGDTWGSSHRSHGRLARCVRNGTLGVPALGMLGELCWAENEE